MPASVLTKPASKKTAVALALVAPVVGLTACAPTEPVATTPGTTPSVWTGSPAPSAEAGEESHGSESSSGSTLEVPINNAGGTEVATATFEFSPGYVTVSVETTGTGQLEPGFHGLHIHQVGECEANSVAPTGGSPGNFNSAGGHFQVPGNSGHPASGDLSSLQVREDGSARLVTTTDAFTEDDLLAGQKTSIIIHEGPDNFANIPPERYNQVNGTPGPDATTMATGDAGSRVACGVIGGE